jgi:predicted nucleotidyltransferase
MNQHTIKQMLTNFSDELIKKFDVRIYSIIWYGSTARGDASKDSDIDIAIIAADESNDLWQKANEIAAEFSLIHDCLISLILISDTRFERMRKIGRLLAVNIDIDGKIIWKKAA